MGQVQYIKTPIAAAQLGVSYTRAINLIRFGKIEPPARDTSGDYIWCPADLARARAALDAMARRRKGVSP